MSARTTSEAATLNRPSCVGLGTITPDPMGELLGTGYMRFESPFGVHGPAKEFSDRVDLLAVVSEEQGRGYFRAFIRHLQATYHTVCVWEVWNATLGDVLRRYGFRPAWEADWVRRGA